MHLVKLPCYCGTLRQAARALTAIYDEHLKDAGIRVTQFAVLQALALHPGLRITDMVAALAIDQTTLSRSLALLREGGLVEVAERPTGREKCWELTPTGRGVLAEAAPLWERAQEEVRTRFGKRRTAGIHQDAYELAEAVLG
jgi:DNA-binding MarR family transcriptional regulator